MVVWGMQQALNFAWSPVFFLLHSIGLALAVIVALFGAVVMFIVLSWRDDRIAAGLFVPYAVWVAFASLLNAAVFALN
jgi:tryptophan-rich sensory protein